MSGNDSNLKPGEAGETMQDDEGSMYHRQGDPNPEPPEPGPLLFSYFYSFKYFLSFRRIENIEKRLYTIIIV